MTVKCEAMAEAAHGAESNQATAGDDSSAKTIEFLRARLLAERASSKSARQQAQEIAGKVKDLHTRLETEIEHRKEVEAAMEKVFTVLKAKGVSVDGITDSSSVYVEETNGVSEKAPSHTEGRSIEKEAPCPLSNISEGTQDGLVECTMDVATVNELHGSVDTCATPGTNPIEWNGDVFSMEVTERPYCHIDKVQDAHIDKDALQPDHDTADCTPIFKQNVGTGQSIQQGLCITSKLKAMLQQIEEEVGALPEEQPLRAELQGWVGQAANLLDRGQGALKNGGLETHHLGDSRQPDISCPPEGVAALETKNIIHTKMPIQSNYADAIHVNHPVSHEIHDITEGVHRREGLAKGFSPAPKAELQQRHLVPSLYTPTSKDTLLHSNLSHQRRPSCESLNQGNMAAYASQDPFNSGPWPQQKMQYDHSHTKGTCSSTIPCTHIPSGNIYIGSESSYLVDVPSPKSSNVLSIGDKMGYAAHVQKNEFWSPARAAGLEGQNAWASPARVERQPRAMLSNGYFMKDTSNELLVKLERAENVHIQGGHSFSHSTHLQKARDVRNYNIEGTTARQSKGRFPLHDAALSLMDDRSGRLGNILMALDAARQHIQDDERMGPSTPTAADARLKRGYRYGDQLPCSEFQNRYGDQLPYSEFQIRYGERLPSSEFQYNPTWRSQARNSHTPIIQFPPSPTSEHGYSPFERPRGAHRRSSSVSTNFMISGWDNYLQQPRGEVSLGNGITLFTD